MRPKTSEIEIKIIIMEVAQAVHMKGGPGDASYGNQDVHLFQQTLRHKSYELLAYPLASTE